jgi:hypothetical protein
VLSHDEPPTYVQETVSVYNLPWPKLRGWLILHFNKNPELDKTLDKNQDGIHDIYYFRIPKRLTEADKVAINGLRETYDSRTNPKVHGRSSPDPPSFCD